MKLQQLHYIYEVANNNLNVSATAEKLFTSQPGISRQIRLFEDELGLEIFTRSGKHLTGITPPGKKILAIAQEILERTAAIREIASEQTAPDRGELTIISSQVGARFILPKVFEFFNQSYPKVDLKVKADAEGDKISDDDYINVDIIVSAGKIKDIDSRVILPCESFDYSLLVPNDHPLAQENSVNIETVLKQPLLVDLNATSGKENFETLFSAKSKKYNVVLDSDDVELIKSYVRMGMGVGIVPSVVYDRVLDNDLKTVSLSNIFEPLKTQISVKKLGCVRSYLIDMVMQLTSNQSSEFLRNALNSTNPADNRFNYQQRQAS